MNQDLSEAYDFMAAHATEWNIDLDRVTSIGDSAGGHLATWSAYTKTKSDGSAAFASAFNIYGPANFQKWDADGYTSGGSKGMPWECKPGKTLYLLTGGDCSDAKLLKISPSNYVTTAVPTISFHGTMDSLVPIDLTYDLHDRLDDNGVDNLVIDVQLADHVLDFGFNGLPQQLLRYSLERLLSGGEVKDEKDPAGGFTGLWITFAILFGACLLYALMLRRVHMVHYKRRTNRMTSGPSGDLDLTVL